MGKLILNEKIQHPINRHGLNARMIGSELIDDIVGAQRLVRLMQQGHYITAQRGDAEAALSTYRLKAVKGARVMLCHYLYATRPREWVEGRPSGTAFLEIGLFRCGLLGPGTNPAVAFHFRFRRRHQYAGLQANPVIGVHKLELNQAVGANQKGRRNRQLRVV